MQNRIVHDEELIARLRRGDEWVFQLLVRRFRENVFSTAFGITFDVQDSLRIFKAVFQDIYDGGGGQDGDLSLSELVHRITVKHCLHRNRRWLQRFKKETEPLVETIPFLSDDRENASPDASADPGRLHVKNTMKKLPESARTIYVLRESLGLSYEEIGKVLSMRPAVVRTHMKHTRRMIHTILHSMSEA